jgi:hypothetical protein
MSWRSKTKLVQEFLSVKRPIDFVPHGKFDIIDSELKGHARFCKKMEGDYVTLVSSLGILGTEQININDKEITISGWVDLPYGALLNLGGSEYVVVTNALHTRIPQDPTQKITVLSVEMPISRSYAAGTSLVLAGFPIQLVGPYASGSPNLMFDTGMMSVPGDAFARFRYEDDIPVLDDWQSIRIVLDRTEYSSETESIRRYYVELEKPLQRDLDPNSRVYMKAVPAYQSQVIPVELDGSYFVDAFTGKTFGTGSDDMVFSVVLMDANKSTLRSAVYSKNDVLVISSFPACDFSLWNRGDGYIHSEEKNATFVCDADGHMCFGRIVPKQFVSFRTTLECLDDFKILVLTSSGRQEYASQQGRLSFSVSETTEHVAVYIKASPNARIRAVNSDAGSRVGFISYSYCVGIDIAESWEGASLILKPCFNRLDDMYSSTDNMQLDSGVILQ